MPLNSTTVKYVQKWSAYKSISVMRPKSNAKNQNVKKRQELLDSPVSLDTPVQGSSTLTPLHELTPDPRYGSVQQPILSLNM